MKIYKKSRSFRLIACFLALNIIVEIISPSIAYALTSGPSQPESSSFEPAGTTQMVDMFSGDFTYNIPLFELPGPDGGYPFNLSYHSGITMDQEASWVGLGWNINPGAINRQVRGLPDEFKGDVVEVQQDMRSMHNFGINAGGSVELFGGDFLKANGGMSLYYNNYRGFGYSMSVGATISDGGDRDGLSGGVGLSFDTQNGVGGKLSVGYEQTDASLGFHSERGLEGSLSYTAYEGDYEKGVSGNGNRSVGASVIGSATHSYSPKVGMEYQTIPLSVNFRLGAGVGAWGLGYVGGFYTVQKLKETDYNRKGYGYFYLEDEGKDNSSLLDFNREKQTLIHEKTPNLPIPVLTADFYNISGQGTGGMFRAWRSDYGSVYDPSSISNVNGGSIGVDLGVPHWGIAGTYTQGKSESGKWTEGNDLLEHFKYDEQKLQHYEPAYFKVYGEKTAAMKVQFSEIGGSRAVRADIESVDNNGNYKVKAAFTNEMGDQVASIPNKKTPDVLGVNTGQQRFIRGQNIEQLTNEWLLDGSDEILPEYKVNFFQTTVADQYLNTPAKLDRSGHEPHHFAGMTVVNKDGNRYVYGLPAMNNEQVEALFSVDENSTSCQPTTPLSISGNTVDYEKNGTDKFLQRTKTPPYAHSYLLTCILGANYVDINDNGPDEADYGYWVKFTYTRAHQNYKWRNPYKEAGFDMGVKSQYSDNKGFYTYGEKEIWYLATAETKSHVAVFNLNSTRSDAKGASGELAKNAGSQSLYSLQNVKLYTRSAYNNAKEIGSFNGALPLQTVEFQYDNSLCKKILNGDGVNGKLTLKKVGFYYQNNKRGLLNKYSFTYGNLNPDYSQYQYNRWGGYNEGTNHCQNLEIPYVSQFQISANQDSLAKHTFQNTRDGSASAWHLSQIETPSGSKINIDYEADDYAYVQHREANQMFYIDKLQSGSNLIYESSDPPTGSDTRVYFKLEDPIPTSLADPSQRFYDQYLKGLERVKEDGTYIQVFFRNYTNLRDNIWEYVSGYSNLKSNGYGVDLTRTANLNLENDGSSTLVNCYTHGYIELEGYHDSRSGRDYHPMAALAWQKMRTDHPDLLTTPGQIKTAPGSSDNDKAMKVKSLINIIPQITKLFKGYLKQSYDKGWASRIDLSKSVIRLCSPDQKKYGGGLRVKKITISDEFVVDGGKDTYGHVYDYTTLNDNGERISSGVATYEPQLGGEENALKFAKTFTDQQSFKSNNHLYFEYPVNESYYPSPSVGYSKVTVRSLATEMVLGKQLSSQTGITGETVHEFYTAKDFPTRASETPIKKRPYHLWIPIPLIGLISNDKLTATQGYAIEVNDMHGKPKAVYYYGANQGKLMKEFPVSSVKYNYRSEDKVYEGRAVKALKNDVFTSTTDVINSDLGVEYEFFADHLLSKSYQVTGGLDGNVEIPIFPLLYIWPSYSESKTKLKTIVLNKVIHRSGILEEVIATDGQSTVLTKNIGFDPYTGEPFLTATTNKFGDRSYHVSGKINSGYIGEGRPFIGTGLKLLYPSHPSYGLYGVLTGSHVFEKLDTTRTTEGATCGFNGCWPVNTVFAPFIKSDYENYYCISGSNFSGNMVDIGCFPGAVIALKDDFGNLYRATALNITINSSQNGEFVHAFYSQDPIPLSTNLTMYILKPAQKNIIDQVIFRAESRAYPIFSHYSENVVMPDGSLDDLHYCDSVINMSPFTYFEEAKDLKDVTSPNPYKSGERGVIYPKATLSYLAERGAKENPELKGDGMLKDLLGGYHVYYPYSNLGGYHSSVADINPWWQITEEFTKFDMYGHQVESRNALGVYSSAKYGYSGTSMVWRTSNAANNQVYFISFEDEGVNLLKLDNTPVLPSIGGHTGSNCLELNNSTEYKIDIKPFDGRKYILSAWIKADEETFDYSVGVNANTRGIRVKYYSSDYTTYRGQSDLLEPVGPIIEGWQKVEGVFEVTSSVADTVEAISVQVLPGATTVNQSSVYSTMKLDDLRIMPNEANMKSYVYDPATYRLQAILDENNFASLYYYDEEGKLFLVKKETEKGVYTVQENRSYQ